MRREFEALRSQERSACLRAYVQGRRPVFLMVIALRHTDQHRLAPVDLRQRMEWWRERANAPGGVVSSGFAGGSWSL